MFSLLAEVGSWGGVLGRRGVEGRIASLELMLNKNQNPIKTHNEYINKIFESTI